MIGINGLEALVLGLLAVLILGPEKLPEYAAALGRLVRNLRGLATGAQQHLIEEFGDELNDVDWRSLDPRQYDPRIIIKEALLDDGPDDAAHQPPQPANTTFPNAPSTKGTPP